MSEARMMGSLADRLLSFVSTTPERDANYDIAVTLLKHYPQLKGMTLGQIANLCYTSKASISRFCRFLGMDSFKAFQAWLEQDFTMRTDYSRQFCTMLHNNQEMAIGSYRDTLISNIYATITPENAEVIPEMQKKLRQGLGRAIRTEQDSCVVAILDERAGIGGEALREHATQILRSLTVAHDAREVEILLVARLGNEDDAIRKVAIARLLNVALGLLPMLKRRGKQRHVEALAHEQLRQEAKARVAARFVAELHAHIKPMLEIVSHMISAEREHSHRVTTNNAYCTCCGCCCLGSHCRTDEYTVLPAL